MGNIGGLADALIFIGFLVNIYLATQLVQVKAVNAFQKLR